MERVSEIEHDLVRPTLELLKLDKNLEIVSIGDVPAGTGMGSSGSYLLALLTALFELKHERVPTQAAAELAELISNLNQLNFHLMIKYLLHYRFEFFDLLVLL